MSNTDISLLDGVTVFTKKAAMRNGSGIGNSIVNAGEISPVQAYIKLRYIRDAAVAALAKVEPVAIEMLGESEYETLGVSSKVRDGYARYAYDHDSEWKELKAGIDELTERMKERQKFLCSLKEPVANLSTGEIEYPAVVTGYTKQSIVLSDK